MPQLYVTSACLCSTIINVFELLHIIDSEKLSGSYFEVIKLVIDGTDYQINTIFEQGDSFLTYLNNELKVEAGLKGDFIEGIDYENIEEFTTIEVVAIILTEYKTVEINTNTDIYQDDDLIGKVLDPRIVVDNQLQSLGMTVIADPVEFDDESGTISNLSLTDTSILSFSYRSPIPA